MSYYKKPWYKNIFLEFYLHVPFVLIQTRMLCESMERLTYDICKLRVEVWKWKWEFQLYKRERL